jgi:hypothetical protein
LARLKRVDGCNRNFDFFLAEKFYINFSLIQCKASKTYVKFVLGVGLDEEEWFSAKNLVVQRMIARYCLDYVFIIIYYLRYPL